MPFRSAKINPVPSETSRAAKSIFDSSLLITIGEELDTITANIDFGFLYRVDERVFVSPVLLALITILQFIEDMADHAAERAVRTRLDWKFALHLPVDYLGVDRQMLVDFRKRVLNDPLGLELFEQMLDRFTQISARGTPSPKSMNDVASVVNAVQVRNSIDLVGDTMTTALEALSAYWPEWMRDIALPHWYERYNAQTPTFRLPRSTATRIAMLNAIGNDGRYLLQAIRQKDAPPLAGTLAEIRRLEIVWRTELVH